MQEALFFVPFFRELPRALVFFLAGAEDLKTHKISNRLLFAGFLAEGILQAAQGTGRMAGALAWAALPFPVLFPLFALRMLGAGDLKLAAFILFCFPGRDGLWLLYQGAAVGAAVSLFRLVKRRLWKKRIRQLLAYLRRKPVAFSGRSEPYYDRDRDGLEVGIPLGACFLPAYLFRLVWNCFQGSII